MAESNVSTQRGSNPRTNQSMEQQSQQGTQLSRREENRGLLTPFGFMRRFSEDMDRLFEDFIRNPFGLSQTGRGLLSQLGAQRAWAPNIEVFQRDSDFVVRAELPGLNKDDVQVEINNDMLTISGERQQEREENRGGVYHSERSYGTFYRSIPLPEGVIPESAQATFKDGVLEITLQAPPSQVTKGRRLEIKDTSETNEQKRK
jgi:HSP20 family protein